MEWEDDGTFCFFEELEVSLFGSEKRKVPHLYNKIRFCGPALAIIVTQYGEKCNCTIASFTPIAPFETKVDFTTYSSQGWGGLWPYFSTLVGYTVEQTVKQDLQIWEHKGNPRPKRLVAGDRPGFNNYRIWLTQFYTESSDAQKTLEW